MQGRVEVCKEVCGACGGGWRGVRCVSSRGCVLVQNTHELAKIRELMKNMEKDKRALEDKVRGL